MAEHPMICIFCASDCSSVPNMRDSQGRYACAECVRAERQRRAAAGNGGNAGGDSRAVAAAGREARPQAQLHEAGEPPDLGYGLADDGDGVAALAPGPIPLAPAAPPPPKDFICPVCIIRMPPDLGRCVQCGYDPKAGIQTSRKVRKKHTKEGSYRPICSQCGYDMTGVPGTRCPECGTVANVARRGYDKAESRRIARWSYIKPAIMLAIGLSGIFLILLLTGQASMSIFYAVKLAVFVPIGVFAFFVCCLLWIGFDAPFHRVALELAGIYAIVDLVSLAVYTIVPVYLINALVVFFVYIGMLASILDLDYADAVAVAFVNLLIRLALLVILLRAFGLI